MKLEGGCYCGSVNFTLRSRTPYPYQHCYCSICRKTNGAGGSAVNLMGLHESLTVDGDDCLRTFRVDAERTEKGGDGLSDSRRRFCEECGTYLWVFNPNYEQWVYPFASATDTELPVPPERNHIMLDYKPDWIKVPSGSGEHHFTNYPDVSIREWHERHGLIVEA